jgi:excinuclease ABC subunit A
MATDEAPIRVRGARTHNLKSIDVDIPARKIVAITGPSGAGKSSLAFDTIYAEAQRRFVESLSTTARQHIERLPRPDVDSIEGLSPAIAIAQEHGARSPRSTLGTVTEISDYLRLLYARVGVPHCPICGDPVRAETPQQIVDELLAMPEGSRVLLLAPVARKAEGDLAPLLARLRKEGYVRAIADGTPIDLGEVTALDKKTFRRVTHELDVVVDRLIVKGDATRVRATDSIELALRLGEGKMLVQEDAPPGKTPKRTWHSERFACEKDDFTFPEIQPRLFSFNTVEGACPTCEGLGERLVPTEARIVPDRSRTLRQGAVTAWGRSGSIAAAVELKRAIDATGVDVDVAWDALPEESRRAILFGVAPKKGARGAKAHGYEGVVRWIERQLDDDEEVGDDERLEDEGAVEDDALEATREVRPCETCGGARLRKEALAITVGGLSIAALGALSLPEARAHVLQVLAASDARWLPVVRPLVTAIADRLGFLEEIGLHYLVIDRAITAMSGGEAARMRLATQLASTLKGVLYVLDEPTVGLHPRDTARLIAVLERLRALGNGVLVVEHDLDVLRAADHVVDVGPVAGKDGGYVVAQGPAAVVQADPKSVTGPFISGAASLPVTARKSIDPARALRLRGASLHNLKSIDVDVPLGVLVGITGPSGSGKSSLIEGTLLPAVRAAVSRRADAVEPVRHLASLAGAGVLDKVIAIDQAPIGRSPRSNPASYVGVLPLLRELFASLPAAAARGYKPGRFSTNVKGGRCEACRGEGLKRVSMSFLPDAWVECEVCHGARFNRETLEIRYRGKSIAEVLGSSVDEAYGTFENVPQVRQRLAALRSVGLGYLSLGQSATTLSGGEAQRVKLARELARRSTTATLYVLDEPTAGLHPLDVSVLLEALVALRDQGNSIVLVEHDLTVVARCDWVIDLGPDAGDAGGRVVAVGTPADVATARDSVTAPFLARVLRSRSSRAS